MDSFALALSTLLFAAPGAAPSPTPSPAPAPTGEEIIRRMHGRYAGKWYRTLTFVRSLQPSKKDPSVINEVQFNDCRKLGGGWVGAEVLFFSGGARKVTEEYSDIRVDVPVDETIFDPSSYRAPGWVR